MLSDKEKRCFKETRLRNLKRRYSKMIQHSELTRDAIELKSEINVIERELNS